MSGGFPLELILLAMVAAFLVLRLRSVLGRREGFERPPQERAAPGQPRPVGVPAAEAPVAPHQPVPGAPRLVVPDGRTPAGQGLARIRAAEAGFDPYTFLGGAEGAFRMIVTAFAAGDRGTLRSLLSDDTYAGFEQAIVAREAAGERQRTELHGVHEMAVEAADLRGTVAEITLRIVSDQVNVTTAANGEIVHGTEAVTELTDLWSFQRDLRSTDPTWKLVGTQSA
ncbi:Tim44/TimA family putative adaptor protein [Roseomonas sp. GC11]|uniref:Tim44/TimA family putative adaptor protein n=1 Tax=Roseomonas sp. GC11 TaxID=2950546 RepID=UPI00210E9465|nr:Tim44/TimA family putative adaptor protein [Roseomonas sp. GC11]MCQ4160460.1 Tim44/TimA family putative adaptor protein [Roseomonas sp. GC11]